ncbi:hypothetical protein CRG98_014262 [Punica granatum]|uniref:Uncharacterized protein n=1 Tax=Punica granatum TaxID=22663 RepID=A0A2I0K9Y8_PUNGR|nr:hypothetical protein CRG98_014262 [Punica granatum]
MATNMTELMAMLRDQNRASSSFTPPPEHRPIVDPNLIVPLTFVSEVEDASFSAMAYAPTAPVPTADQFPSQAPQPQISISYPAPPPLNIPPTKPGTPTQATPPTLPKNIPPEAENEQERRIRRMEETIRALQVGNPRFDFGDNFPRHSYGIGARLVYDPESRRRPYMDRSISEVPRSVSILCEDTPYASRSQHDRDERGLSFRSIRNGVEKKSHNLRNDMLLLKLNRVDPRLRDLLSRLNVLQP